MSSGFRPTGPSVGTKIVATIGPATANPASLLALLKAGMSVARLNGSHADLDWHRATVRMLRDSVPDVPILLDIPGRKIRTIGLAHEPSFGVGDVVVLTTDTSFDGRVKVPVNYRNLHLDLRPGHTILADDGTLRFTVDAIDGADIHCRAMSAGTLRSRKGINVPFVHLGTELVTDRDRQMVAFAKDTGVDFIGISFVESAAHVRAIRDLVGGRTPQILAKVENQGGLDRVDEIVGEADAIMIDRGDLSVETSLESVAISQKRIIDRARLAGKPVVVATEMLHSMIVNDVPTKAEVVDISNAVLDGCSATMLSGETAIGSFPVSAVTLMRGVADAAFAHLLEQHGSAAPASTPANALVDAIAQILRAMPITKVVAITRSGFAARMLSARSVPQPILAISDDAAVARSFNILAGVEGFYTEVPFPRGSADHIKGCLHYLYERGRLDVDDFVLITGVVYPRSGTRMNMLQVHRVADLVDEFGWEQS
jgi:pyruvate kinase